MSVGRHARGAWVQPYTTYLGEYGDRDSVRAELRAAPEPSVH